MSIIYEALKETQAKRASLSVPLETVEYDLKSLLKTITKKGRVAGYFGFSTDKQDLDNQKSSVLKLANEKGWTKVDFVEETMSGTVSYNDRKLSSLLNELNKGDILVIAELSCLGRSVLEISDVLKASSEKGIKIYGIKENLEIDGNTIESKVLYKMLALVLEIERDLISKRNKEALTAKKAQGLELCRSKGVPRKFKLDGKQEEIKVFLEKGLNVTALSKIYGVSWACMKNFLNKKIYNI